MERLARAYIRNLPLKGARVDVPGADIGTNAQIMAWMLDEYESITGIHSPAALNDKPAAAGGTVGSSEATGRGVFYVLRQAVKDYNLPLNSRVAVQGFGTVGSNLARLLDQEGFRVVAISDVYGALYAGDGINVEALAEFVRETGSVVGFPGAEAISNQDLLELAVEVLVPAAVQSCIHAGNGGAVKAKLVVEAANGPVTPKQKSCWQQSYSACARCFGQWAAP